MARSAHLVTLLLAFMGSCGRTTGPTDRADRLDANPATQLDALTATHADTGFDTAGLRLDGTAVDTVFATQSDTCPDIPDLPPDGARVDLVLADGGDDTRDSGDSCEEVPLVDATVARADVDGECHDDEDCPRRPDACGYCSLGVCMWDPVLECCSHVECDDGDPCNGTEYCEAGYCVPDCAPYCPDDDVCNGIETCEAFVGCQDGVPLDCRSEDPCRVALPCDPEIGCRYEAAADGTPCLSGACQGGRCEPRCGADADCSPSQACLPQGWCAARSDPARFCSEIGTEGCCDGLVATRCEGGRIVTEHCLYVDDPGDCAVVGSVPRFEGCRHSGGAAECRPDLPAYLDPDDPDPYGYETVADCPWNLIACGSDGECATGQRCYDGVCVADPCAGISPFCTGRDGSPARCKEGLTFWSEDREVPAWYAHLRLDCSVHHDDVADDCWHWCARGEHCESCAPWVNAPYCTFCF